MRRATLLATVIDSGQRCRIRGRLVSVAVVDGETLEEIGPAGH